MLALGAPQETGEAAGLPERGEAVVPARQNLPRIPLMTDVPDDLVPRRIEAGEQGDGEFDHAQARPDVAAGLRHHVDQPATHLGGKIRQLIARDSLKVFGTVDRIEECHQVLHERRLTTNSAKPASSLECIPTAPSWSTARRAQARA